MALSCRLAATIHPVFQRAAREALTDTNRQSTLAALPFMGVMGRGGVMVGECWADVDEGRTDADKDRADEDEGRVDVDEGRTDADEGRVDVEEGGAEVVLG